MSYSITPERTIPTQSAHRQSAGEKHLIRAAQNGDISGFNALVRLYQNIVYQTAYRVMGESEAAADATQEAFVSAYKHIRSFRGDSFRGWLMRIVTNACYDQMRERRRHPTSSLEALFVGSRPLAPAAEPLAADTPPELAERQELGEIIQKGLQTLPFDSRMTLVLFDVQGFSYQEISEITGTHIGTVKSRLFRARALLRSFLLAQQDVLPRRYRAAENAPVPA